MRGKLGYATLGQKVVKPAKNRAHSRNGASRCDKFITSYLAVGGVGSRVKETNVIDNKRVSLRKLFEELNFEFSDEPASKLDLTTEEKNAIIKSETTAKKFGYGVYYLQTHENDFKMIRKIATRIIKNNNGLCLVCSHNPDGFKWTFSTSSHRYSMSFNSTQDLPLVTPNDTKISKPSIEFLENMRAPKQPNALAFQKQISTAFDMFIVQIQSVGYSEYHADEHDKKLVEIEHAIELEPRPSDLRLVMGTELNELDRPGEALEASGRAVRLGSENVDAHIGMSDVLQHLGCYDEAALALDHVACLMPDDDEALDWHEARSLKARAAGSGGHGQVS